MNKLFRYVSVGLVALVLAACDNGKSPGALQGSWQMTGPVPMKISFRNGETEAMGMIEKVSYKTDGKDVLVTYLDGIAKGTTMRYTITGQNTAKTELGTLKRIN